MTVGQARTEGMQMEGSMAISKGGTCLGLPSGGRSSGGGHGLQTGQTNINASTSAHDGQASEDRRRTLAAALPARLRGPGILPSLSRKLVGVSSPRSARAFLQGDTGRRERLQVCRWRSLGRWRRGSYLSRARAASTSATQQTYLKVQTGLVRR
jgi:hypothetical protein